MHPPPHLCFPGVWLEETATPYYMFKDAGFEVEMASPAGGPSPIDAASLSEGFFTESVRAPLTTIHGRVRLTDGAHDRWERP